MTVYSSYTFDSSTGEYTLAGTSYNGYAEDIAKKLRTYRYTKRSGIFMELWQA
jgi:hypothetical protein